MKTQLRSLSFAFLLLIGALMLASCQPAADPSPSTPVSSEDTETPRTPASKTGNYEERVYVEGMQINLMESFPVQVSVSVEGNLPDGCTTIVDKEARLVDDNTFEVHLYTERPEDLMCTQALVPFQETVQLDVEGLPAGTYNVNVYDLSDTFTLEVDNE